MIPRIRLLFSLAFVLAAAGSSAAQSNQPITIKSVRFGLPPSPFTSARDSGGQPLPVFKAGAWAPIQIVLDCDFPAEMAGQEIEITATTPDGDDTISQARYRLKPPVGRQSLTLPGNLFLKPGDIAAEIRVQAINAGTRKKLAETYLQQGVGLTPARYLLFSAGSALDGIRLSQVEGQSGESAADATTLRSGWVQLGQTMQAGDLPDRWFGYDAVDLLILCAGERSFWDELARSPERCTAIADWVRQGGRALISGQASIYMQDIPILRPIVPFAAAAAAPQDEVALVLPNSPRLLLRREAGRPIPVVTMKARGDSNFQVRLAADELDNAYPLVVQAPYGLGRVTAVSFDLDRQPFEQWQYREIFWDWLINACGTRLPSGNEVAATDVRGEEEADRYVALLHNNLEFFEGVTVVSFGWVSMLILLYILVIGPLEYLLLKRLFRRMELTWITFPIIVVTVCLGAYWAAVAIKGRETRINKVDLLEIDLAGKRVYGRTWFNIFSPRTESLDLAVEPQIAGSTERYRLVSWSGKAKSTRQSLLRRSYDYRSFANEPDFADGLDGVPIQVWSTKSFTARWSAEVAGRDLLASTLHRAPADPNQLTGSITSFLPSAAIIGAQLFYRDRVTAVPSLVQGLPSYLSTGPQSPTITSWLHNNVVPKELIPSNRTNKAASTELDASPHFRLWPMLFHDAFAGQFARLANASERELDQSWRVSERSRNEAILIARLRCHAGPFAEMSDLPDAVTRLKLGRTGSTTPHSDWGTLRQETYIRVYLPISDR